MSATDIFSFREGKTFDAPAPNTPGLNPPVKAGDSIRVLCRLTGGDAFWHGPHVVKYLSGDHPVYRPRFAKVDKVAPDWHLVSPTT